MVDMNEENKRWTVKQTNEEMKCVSAFCKEWLFARSNGWIYVFFFVIYNVMLELD